MERLKGFSGNLDFDKITHSTLSKFVTYLYAGDEKQGFSKLSPNTAQKYVSQVKTFMRATKKRGHHNQDAWKDFNLKKVSVSFPFLKSSEVETIYNE